MKEKIELQANTRVVVNYSDACPDKCVFAEDKRACAAAFCTADQRIDGKNVYFTRPKLPAIESTILTITKERIAELALQNGFKLKLQEDGSMALNSYIFDFIDAVLKDVQK